jgi:hypothetical protein
VGLVKAQSLTRTHRHVSTARLTSARLDLERHCLHAAVAVAALRWRALDQLWRPLRNIVLTVV